MNTTGACPDKPVWFKHSENCTLLDAVLHLIESSGEWAMLTGDVPFIDSVDLLNTTPDGSFNPDISRKIHSGENHPALKVIPFTLLAKQTGLLLLSTTYFRIASTRRGGTSSYPLRCWVITVT